jgi:hypothetical protein
MYIYVYYIIDIVRARSRTSSTSPVETAHVYKPHTPATQAGGEEPLVAWAVVI